MRVGIVAEFNPLHSGHKYLIDQAKKLIAYEKDASIICVMSEFFTQRGEVCIVDGYSRAKEAILAGCDLVLALPYRASVSYSDDFAKHSVSILVKCGITHLIFGTEKDISDFEEIYEKEHSETLRTKIKELIKDGMSYPKIMSTIFGVTDSPNFILAYSYFKAIKKFAPHIKLVPIKREGQLLSDSSLVDSKFLSATAIRKNIFDDKIKNYLSENMMATLLNSKIIDEQSFYLLLAYKIRSLGKDGLKNIYDISEGLENRIYESNLAAKNYAELVDLISTKRYSKKRIQRILIHILTNSTKEEMSTDINDVRVLAVRKDKTNIIKQINNSEKIKIHQKLKKENGKYFDHDIRVSRIYNLIADDEDIFKKNVMIINEGE